MDKVTCAFGVNHRRCNFNLKCKELCVASTILNGKKAKQRPYIRADSIAVSLQVRCRIVDKVSSPMTASFNVPTQVDICLQSTAL